MSNHIVLLLKDLGGFTAAFLLWTFMIYWLHRLSHIRHQKNPLWQLHCAHHATPYLSAPSLSPWPKFAQLFFWLGSWRATLDVLVVMTLPALLIALIAPRYGLMLLAFHYFYEVFCSEYALDHNPRIQGFWTRIFAWGDFHLFHHISTRNNYGLIITLWDRVFGSAVDPIPGTAMERQKKLIGAKLKRI
jgi:sterol desaturase/sphingolipid hydroxylase (fatty acid hydroxylase superfamily)